MAAVDARTLTHALLALPPRDAKVLVQARVEGQDLAQQYGIAREAARVLLWRSAVGLEAAVDGRAGLLPRAFSEEQAEALRLQEGAGPLVPLLEALRSNGPEVRALMAKAEAEAEASPARHRETWLRRLAIVVILGLAAWFYWQDQHRPLPPPQARPGMPGAKVK